MTEFLNVIHNDRTLRTCIFVFVLTYMDTIFHFL